MTTPAITATVPVAQLGSVTAQEAPKPAAAIVGFIVVKGRTIPMMADHPFSDVSAKAIALARHSLEEEGLG
jgi:hypothetical protein